MSSRGSLPSSHPPALSSPHISNLPFKKLSPKRTPEVLYRTASGSACPGRMGLSAQEEVWARPRASQDTGGHWRASSAPPAPLPRAGLSLAGGGRRAAAAPGVYNSPEERPYTHASIPALVTVGLVYGARSPSNRGGSGGRHRLPLPRAHRTTIEAMVILIADACPDGLHPERITCLF
jgi:hypothetical protein